jgi:fatty-acid desaturase
MKLLSSSANSLSIIQSLALIGTLAGLPFVDFTTANVALMFVGYVMLAILGTSITFHRYYSHKSFEFKTDWLKHLFTFFGIIAGRGSPLGWSYVHRMHHAHADTTEDPHYMGVHGWKVILPGFMKYGEKINKRYIRDLLTPYHLFINQYYMGFIAIWALILAAISFEVLYFFYVVPLVFTFISLNLFVLLTHKYGYRTHNTKDESRQNWLVSLLLLGEGWHNTHHSNPGRYRLKEKWWELDFCGDIIGLVKR